VAESSSDRDLPARVLGTVTPTGSIQLPPKAPEVIGNPTGSIQLPTAPDGAPVSGPIAFRRPSGPPGDGTALTRRVRGAQLPDTGEAPAATPSTRPERSAQSVRGALQSFSAGRRTASEYALGHGTGPIPTEKPTTSAPGTPTADRPATDKDPSAGPAPATSTNGRPNGSAPADGPTPITAASGAPRSLPRRVRGAQMPETDLPSAAPAPERSAAEVRAALSNFVAGRRAAEHDDE
jgi:hypothetical protein